MANILMEIQKKILNQRSEPITPSEINRLFQIPITPEFNMILYTALKRKIIDPDLTLIQAIGNALNPDYLIPIALCLRFGADANLYVLTPKLGTIHILGYIYIKLFEVIDENLLNTIILLFLVQGTRTSLWMFDSKAGKIRGPEDQQPDGLSVSEWLMAQSYNTILDRLNTGEITEVRKFVDDDSLMILSIMLDKPNYAVRPYKSSDLILAIRSFSLSSFDKIPTLNEKMMTDYYSLEQTVIYLNSDAYINLIKRGQIPSYVLMNTIIVNMKQYYTDGHTLASQELEKMLLEALKVGVELDAEQFAIISTMGSSLLSSVNKEYERPYWQKVCASKDPNIPESLQRLAISLNLDDHVSKPALCDSISKLAKADIKSLKEAGYRRQQSRMVSELGTINEFIGDKPPVLTCRNRSELLIDPFDYNDHEIAYYRDDQGVIWCFGSDSFNNLIETGINPYNSTLLPKNFISQLQYQRSIIQSINKPHLSFSKALDSLTSKDTIIDTLPIIDRFIQQASNNGVGANIIKSLSKDQMMSALRSINYNVNLNPLTTNHAIITTAQILQSISNDESLVQQFFRSLI